MYIIYIRVFCIKNPLYQLCFSRSFLCLAGGAPVIRPHDILLVGAMLQTKALGRGFTFRGSLRGEMSHKKTLKSFHSPKHPVIHPEV